MGIYHNFVTPVEATFAIHNPEAKHKTVSMYKEVVSDRVGDIWVAISMSSISVSIIHVEAEEQLCICMRCFCNLHMFLLHYCCDRGGGWRFLIALFANDRFLCGWKF